MLIDADYSDLTHKDLVARLAAAETVCVLYGWSPASFHGDVCKATHEAWRDWLGHVDDGFTSPATQQALRDSVPALAAMRDGNTSRNASPHRRTDRGDW